MNTATLVACGCSNTLQSFIFLDTMGAILRVSNPSGIPRRMEGRIRLNLSGLFAGKVRQRTTKIIMSQQAYFLTIVRV